MFPLWCLCKGSISSGCAGRERLSLSHYERDALCNAYRIEGIVSRLIKLCHTESIIYLLSFACICQFVVWYIILRRVGSSDQCFIQPLMVCTLIDVESMYIDPLWEGAFDPPVSTEWVELLVLPVVEALHIVTWNVITSGHSLWEYFMYCLLTCTLHTWPLLDCWLW